MDILGRLQQAGNMLRDAKDFTAEHYRNKELGKRSNTGVRGKGNFGGTPRMAGSAGVSSILGELIYGAVDTHVKPAIEKKGQEIRRSRMLDKHQRSGERLFIPPSVGI